MLLQGECFMALVYVESDIKSRKGSFGVILTMTLVIHEVPKIVSR